jgi:hypothetical protein
MQYPDRADEDMGGWRTGGGAPSNNFNNGNDNDSYRQKSGYQPQQQ